MKHKKLKILFDASAIVNGNKSGIGYYAYGLLDSLAEYHQNDVEIVAHYFNFLGRKKDLQLPQHPNIRYRQSRLMPGKVLNVTRKLGTGLPLELLFKTSGDVAVFPNFVSLPSILNIPRVITIHDLCFEEVPQYVSKKNRDFLRQFVPRSISSAASILTISDSTKRAIRKNYPWYKGRIIAEGIPATKVAELKPKRMTNIPSSFILFVSTLEPRKNIISLVKAYELLPDKLRDTYPLVLAGGTGWEMEEDIQYIKSSIQNGNQIILTGYVTDQEREWLYRNATIFVMPSHYEGFGMPILEAMAYGRPTAVSDIDVFHEVGDDVSLYFDKDQPKSIMHTLKQLLTDSALRKNLGKKGLHRSNQYSWQDISASVFQELLGVSRERQ